MFQQTQCHRRPGAHAYRAPDHERLERGLRSAELAVRRGRLKAGARQALAIAADAGSEPASLNRIGDLLVRARRLDRAVSLFERVAKAYADDGFWAKSIAIYKKILRFDPGRRDVERTLATLYKRSGLPTRLARRQATPVRLDSILLD